MKRKIIHLKVGYNELKQRNTSGQVLLFPFGMYPT